MGHRFRFISEGPVTRWSCRRGCGAGGQKTYKTYKSAGQARRYGEALDRDDVDQLGRLAPLMGLLPLRIWYAMRRRRSRVATPGKGPSLLAAGPTPSAVGRSIGRVRR